MLATFLTALLFADPALVAVQPAGKEPTLRLGGLLQIQAEFGDRGDTRWDNDNDRIFLRRARINVQGRFLEEFEFKFEADAAGTLSSTSGLRLQLTDGYLDWKRYAFAVVRVGQFKTPFGYEQLYPDPRLFTPERSLVNDRLTLSRQLGAQVGGDFLDGRLSYSAGLFNGSGANNSGNDNDQFLYAGRVSGILQRGPLLGAPSRLSVGGNGFTDEANGVPLSADFGFTSGLFTGKRVGSGVDLQWQMGRFELWLEALQVKYEPADGLPAPEIRSDGGYAQLGCFVVAKRLQAVAKYEVFDPSDRAQNDDRAGVIVGGNLFFKGDDIKLQAHYYRSDVEGAPEKESKAILRMQAIF